MCGIFGIASDPGHRVDPDLLWFATHRVRHRGPNDWGFAGVLPVRSGLPEHCAWRFWGQREQASSYRIGLGSRRLSILDLSDAGHQPMNLPGTGLWAVFNGEIYNYLELRTELASERSFATDSDTEVLLAAYEKWGEECLARFNGMFALAIWDEPRKRLFMARDRFGEKPFYYYRGRTRFVFASELKQYFEDSEFRRDLDFSALADFLLFALQDHDERTFFRDVRQLPPAHWLEWNAEMGKMRGPYRYWTPAMAEDLDTSRDCEFEERLEFLLRDSIRLRLRSDVRTGICLSGGLDSTSICSLASCQAGATQPLAAYTMAFPGAREDESRLAGKAAKQANVRLVTATMDPSDLSEHLHDFVYFQDGPTGGASNFASWRIFETARADGSIVLLNGQGGDELLAGYSKFYFFWLGDLIEQGRWMRFTATAAKYLAGNGLSRWNYAEARRYFPSFLRKRLTGMWQFSRPEFRKRATEAAESGRRMTLNLRLWRDLSALSLPCLLHWEDRNSMAVSTEARLPFLDHRLVEAVLATSVYTKLKNGYTKYSLRRVMSKLLPPEICWRRQKRGFDTPARSWFKVDLAPYMRQILSGRDSPLSHLVSTPRLLQNFERFLRTDDGALTENDWFRIASTSAWLDQLPRVSHQSQSALAAD